MRSGSAAKNAGPSSTGNSRARSKDAVAAAAAGEHAEVELLADRVPLARQARRERQLDRAARRTGRAASRSRDPPERPLELAEDAFGRVLRHRRRQPHAQPLAQRVVGEVAADRLAERRACLPAATSRPFTPSWTTSATPPASIASTGVPTASASTTVCGKFSQLDERIVASAA